MNPEHLLFAMTLLVPWAVLAMDIKLFHGKHKAFAFVASAALIYAALLLHVSIIDARLENELNAFDLNGDGMFSGAEITPAQQAAMANWANDTARAMAPITGAIFSVIYTAVSFLVHFLASWCWSKYRAKHN